MIHRLGIVTCARNARTERAMKWTVGLLVMILPQLIWAQAQSIKINPLSLFALTPNVQYERQLNDRFSGQIGVFGGGVNLRDEKSGIPGKIKYHWWGITPEVRYFISFTRMQVPRGLYVAPFMRYQRYNEQYVDQVFDPDRGGMIWARVENSSGLFGGGFLLGYQLIGKSGFVLDMYMGPKYGSGREKVTIDCTTCNGNEVPTGDRGLSFEGVKPRAGISLGYFF